MKTEKLFESLESEIAEKIKLLELLQATLDMLKESKIYPLLNVDTTEAFFEDLFHKVLAINVEMRH